MISIANALTVAFMGVAGGLYLEWKAGNFLKPEGVFLFILDTFFGIFTIASYSYLFKLTDKSDV